MEEILMRKKGAILLCILLMLSLYACRTNDSANINEVATDIILEETEVMNSFVSWCPYPDDYLKELCDTYELEKLTENCQSDYEKVETITNWVSGLWSHDGMNQPEQDDPMYILDQVINHGQRYRCVEYGTVISGCLNALGFECRQLGLKTKDVETREVGAGHVGAEVYLEDLKKWVFIDGQWGAIPMLGDTPLSAYEFGVAIREKDSNLRINWANNVYQAPDSEYFEWIEPYLYYMDSQFKNVDGGYTDVMFVPDDGKNVTVFQRNYDIDIDYYLRDVSVFYYR